ncbi:MULTISPECIES: hypothetical protein [unclassified Flavobacterium]|uniref:hypothetical protein n=1 Tax=unclassified Flavobacterium TaxID=196869 RepID=UPI003622D28B
MKRTLLCLTLGFLTIGCQFASDLDEKSPQLPDTKTVLMSSSGGTTALAFVNEYAKVYTSMDEAQTLQWVSANALVTPEFRDSLTHLITESLQKNPESGLKFNPIFDAQENPEEGFEVVSTDSKTGYITLRGKHSNELKLNLKMKNVNDTWLVDGCGIVNIPLEKRIQR